MTPRLLSRLRRIYRCPACGRWRIRPIPSDPNRRPHECVVRDPDGAPRLQVIRGQRQSPDSGEGDVA